MNYFNPHSVVASNDQYLLLNNGKFVHHSNLTQHAVHSTRVMSSSNMVFNNLDIMINFLNISQCTLHEDRIEGFTLTGANFKFKLPAQTIADLHHWNQGHGVLA